MNNHLVVSQRVCPDGRFKEEETIDRQLLIEDCGHFRQEKLQEHRASLSELLRKEYRSWTYPADWFKEMETQAILAGITGIGRPFG